MSSYRVCLWLAGITSFLLSVFAGGYLLLDTRKADKETIVQMAQDIREMRTYFLGAQRP